MVAIRRSGKTWYAERSFYYVVSNASQVDMAYPLPQIVGPLNFVQSGSDKDESSENAEEREENIRNQPADQSSQSDRSDAESVSSEQKIYTGIRSFRRLPILAELDLSPVQERLTARDGKTDNKA
jgi:hypothetical protein